MDIHLYSFKYIKLEVDPLLQISGLAGYYDVSKCPVSANFQVDSMLCFFGEKNNDLIAQKYLEIAKGINVLAYNKLDSSQINTPNLRKIGTVFLLAF